MTVRERLREMNVRLVELATYLNVSRPTIYKYLELYENKEFNKIDKVIYDLFSYIDSDLGISKPALMNYLINKIVPADELVGDKRLSRVIESIRKLSESQKPDDEKKFESIEAILFDS